MALTSGLLMTQGRRKQICSGTGTGDIQVVWSLACCCGFHCPAAVCSWGLLVAANYALEKDANIDVNAASE